jgi:hypothetical protein
MASAVLISETEQKVVSKVPSFVPVSCLLSLEELSAKIEEQVTIAWNGPNG